MITKSYRNLISAIIYKAINDYRDSERYRADAEVFLKSEWCKEMCENMHIPHTRVLAKAGIKEKQNEV